MSPHVCFILDLILNYMFLRICTYELESPTLIDYASEELKQNKGRGFVDRKLVDPPPHVISLLAVPRRLFYFGSLDIDVVCGYDLLVLLDINIENK